MAPVPSGQRSSFRVDRSRRGVAQEGVPGAQELRPTQGLEVAHLAQPAPKVLVLPLDPLLDLSGMPFPLLG